MEIDFKNNFFEYFHEIWMLTKIAVYLRFGLICLSLDINYVEYGFLNFTGHCRWTKEAPFFLFLSGPRSFVR